MNPFATSDDSDLVSVWVKRDCLGDACKWLSSKHVFVATTSALFIPDSHQSVKGALVIVYATHVPRLTEEDQMEFILRFC